MVLLATAWAHIRWTHGPHPPQIPSYAAGADSRSENARTSESRARLAYLGGLNYARTRAKHVAKSTHHLQVLGPSHRGMEVVDGTLSQGTETLSVSGNSLGTPRSAWAHDTRACPCQIGREQPSRDEGRARLPSALDRQVALARTALAPVARVLVVHAPAGRECPRAETFPSFQRFQHDCDDCNLLGMSCSAMQCQGLLFERFA